MAKKAKKELTPEERLAAARVPKEEWLYELPEGWEWVYWGGCGKFEAGSGFKNEFQGFTEHEIPFYKVGSLKYTDLKGYLDDFSNTISEEIRIKLKAKLIPPGSIIFAKIGEAIRLNRRSINKISCCIDNNLMSFYPECCLLKYVYYWSMSVDLYKLTNATTVPAIRKSDLERIPFPLPPLETQQRIVDHIESLFAKLDQAKEKAQQALATSETRKAAILHQAFTGQLTAHWRQEHSVSMESWEEVKLQDVCEKITDGTHHSPENLPEGEYMYVTAKNIKESGVDLTNITYVTKEVHDEIYSRCDVKFGDVLYIKDGATTGIATVNGIEEPFSLLSSVAVLRPMIQRLDPNYLAFNLNSSETKAMMVNNMSGNAITRLTLKKIKDAEIMICSLDEQQEIVRILETLMANEQRIQQAVETILQQIDDTKKSILAKAFRGEWQTTLDNI